MAPLPLPVITFIFNVFLQVLAFSLPPFRYRSAIFVPLLLATAIYTNSGPVYDDPHLMYTVGTLWPSLITALDRLIFGTVELKCWADGDAPGEAAAWGFGWRKIKWSMKLWTDARGVRWNYRVKGMREARKESRWGFVARNIAWSAVLSLTCDLCYSLVFKDHQLDERGRYLSTVTGGLHPIAIARKFALAYTTWWALEVNHVLLAALAVASGQYTPEDWPPAFGRLKDFTTVAKFWSCVWHQFLRRTLTAYSSGILRALRIPRSSPISRPLALLIAFGICGVGHAIPLRVMRGATQEYLNSIVLFFILQAVAITFESIFFAVYKRVTGWDGSWWGGRAVGRVWCVLWFAATLPLFWDPMIAVGVMQGNLLPVLWLNSRREGRAGKFLAGLLMQLVPEQWKGEWNDILASSSPSQGMVYSPK